MRVLYPELVFGAIASSGVTFATIKDWQYFDIIRQFAPADCIHQIEVTVQTVDKYLIHSNSTRDTIKTAFALQNLTNDHDFASLLSVSCLVSMRGCVVDLERLTIWVDSWEIERVLNENFLTRHVGDWVTSWEGSSRRLARQ